MKKLRSKKGFTLAEMLIAVMLLGFVSLMATVMTSAVLNTSVTMKEVAQAEILGTEALDNLQREIRFGTNITVDNSSNIITFSRQSTNKEGCTFDVDETGKIVVKYYDGGAEKSELLFGGASYGNLKITDLTFARGDEKSGPVNISLSVAYGKKVLWSGNLSVMPLSGNVDKSPAGAGA